jgi:hypothetical protein
MVRAVRRLPLLLVAMLIATPAWAQRYVTTSWVYLRRSPSNTGAKLRTLHKGDTLSARTVSASPGWTPVRTQDGKAGWVGTAYVRTIEDSTATGVGVTPPSGNPTPTVGGIASRIDPSWEKLPLVSSTITMQGGAVQCGQHGDGADDGTNLHKNRADVPAAPHAISLDAIRALPDTALWRWTNRQHWTAADSTLVLPYEGMPVTVEGYLEIVKPQSSQPPAPGKKVGESPNCHSWTERDTDWHMALVADPSETEERAVVVEPTPRSKRANPTWTVQAAQAIAIRKTPSSPRDEAGALRVRVTGWLLLDPVHPAHIRGHCAGTCTTTKFYRATLWEVHPVTKIEVLRNGAWVELR